MCGGAIQPNSLTGAKCGHEQRVFFIAHYSMTMAQCLPFFKIEDGVGKLHLSDKKINFRVSCFVR